MRSPVPGYIYVLELTGGVTKVGYASVPANRLGQLARDLKLDDREITRHWTSPRHIEAGLNEETLIEECERLGGVHYGPDRAREWFTGLRFEDVVAAANALQFTACGKEEGIPMEEARMKLGDLIDHARLAGQSTVITRHGKPAAIIAPMITDDDRDLIARARELAALSGKEIREQARWDDTGMILADFAGRAQLVLVELADRLARQEQDAGSTT
jgi:prevent-host-death family protein